MDPSTQINTIISAYTTLKPQAQQIKITITQIDVEEIEINLCDIGVIKFMPNSNFLGKRCPQGGNFCFCPLTFFPPVQQFH